MSKYLVWTLLAVMLLACVVVAEDQPSSVMAGILTRDGIGARAIALGTSFTALADDTTAGYYNPAGLAFLPGIRTGGMYESKFDPSLGINFQYMSATYMIDSLDLGTGLTLVRRNDKAIPTIGGSFDASETLLLLSGGWDFAQSLELDGFDGLAVGANVKVYLSSGYEDANARGIGMDLSALFLYDIGRGWIRIGFRSSDVFGSSIQWRDTRNEIKEVVPWGQHIGIAFSLLEPALTATADATVFLGQPDLNSLHVGVEYTLFGISLRAGFKDGTPVIGAGIRALDWLRVDLAMVFHGDLGQSLIASTEFSF